MKTWMGRVTVIVLAICSLNTESWSQGPPINTDTPIMIGLEGRGLRTFGKIIRKATLRKDGSEIVDPLDQRITVWVTPLAVPYNLIGDEFQLGVIVPFMYVDLNTTVQDRSSSGIGEFLHLPGRQIGNVLMFLARGIHHGVLAMVVVRIEILHNDGSCRSRNHTTNEKRNDQLIHGAHLGFDGSRQAPKNMKWEIGIRKRQTIPVGRGVGSLPLSPTWPVMV